MKNIKNEHITLARGQHILILLIIHYPSIRGPYNNVIDKDKYFKCIRFCISYYKGVRFPSNSTFEFKATHLSHQ